MPRVNRFNLSELTPNRLYDAMFRRLADIPSAVSWETSAKAAANKERIAQLRNTHSGENCVIVCNGPSLRDINMTELTDHFKITMNRAYLSFSEWGWISDLHVSINGLVIEQFSRELGQLSIPLFTSYNYRRLFRGRKNTLFLRIPNSLGDRFETDLTGPISAGGTVTFAALQIAYYLGFKRAVIIGMDHRFSAKGTPNTTQDRIESADRDHFRPDYFPKGSKWQLPDLYRSELAYALARRAFEADGREVIDATVNGACDVFPKMSLEEALGHRR